MNILIAGKNEGKYKITMCLDYNVSRHIIFLK